MKRLIEKGLMFGSLFEVSSPVLVERYNRALQHLTGKRTALTDFHIDISGYSPEIGDELGDHLYLNAAGVNRQFILLSTDQQSAPLLNVQFSTSRGILRQFIAANEAQLFALTARDAVAGELDNSVFLAETPAQLLDIRRIRVVADTTEGTAGDADKLRGLVNRFKSEEDAWFDDVLIAEMITLAKRTGDVTRNPVRLTRTEFEQKNFWTAHFGNIYVFRDLDVPAAITCKPKAEVGEIPVLNVLDLNDRNEIAKFLELNGLVEPIVRARGIDAAAILRQKMDFIVVDTAAEAGIHLQGATRRDLRAVARANIRALPQAYHGLAAMLNWVENGGRWPQITSGHPSYFYGLRAANHPDRDLVNMLLAELTPMDVRQLYICHKELFYRLYRGWSDAKKTYVADFLEREYQVDKAGARAALFGHDAPMDDAGPAPHEDLIDLVGPWGAVPRKGR